MSYYSPSIEKLVEAFEKLPSIGHKTAVRLAFHMLDASIEETNEFIRSYTKCKSKFKILLKMLQHIRYRPMFNLCKSKTR